MSFNHTLRTAIAIGAFSLLAATPVLAQGNSRGKGNDRARGSQVERERPTLQRRGADALRLPRGDDRYDRRDDRDRRASRDRRSASWEEILFGRNRDGRANVPPGWCIGRGNPHNTPRNCGYSSSRRYDWDRDDRYGGYGTYERAHAAFHRLLDREYTDLSASRRGDRRYQLQLREQKASDHQRWHARIGRRH